MKTVMNADGLHRSFGGLMAVNGVSFGVREGEIFGLIGPNGAGKTTLFNLLTGLTPVTGGTFSYKGELLTGLPPHRIARRGIGRTFQNIRLFKGVSVLENIRIAHHGHTRTGLWGGIFGSPGARREERQVEENARNLLELVGLSAMAHEPASTLAYGDQRRLEIARALALRPKVLLLDEPAAGMNVAEKQELTAFIRSIRDTFELTILIIEHHVPLVMNLCDRVAVLNFGELIALGSTAEVQKDPAVIEAYLGSG